MKERGQVFSFDMLLALIIAMLIVSSSGVALSLTQKRASNYISQYSLNRVASDSADVLVKSPGKPADWEENSDRLKTPGLASFDKNLNQAVPNLILIEKITWLRELTRNTTWDVSTEKTQAIMSLFGGTQNFEITVFMDDNLLWKFWPGWDVESTSGVEDSLEVASIERQGLLSSKVEERLTTEPLVKKELNQGVNHWYENWRIQNGELDTYDWYIYVYTSTEPENQPDWVDIQVNDEGGWYEFEPTQENPDRIFPEHHGGIENDEPQGPVYEGIDNLHIKLKPTGQARGDWAAISVLAAPACMRPADVVLLREGPIQIGIKVWR